MFEKKLLQKLADLKDRGIIPEKYYHIIYHFYFYYKQSTYPHVLDEKNLFSLFDTYLNLIAEQFIHPFTFMPFHKKTRFPIDYYQFGLDFFRPLINFSSSSLLGQENLKKMLLQLKNRENVIFFANHQTEIDPHCISLLLEKNFPSLGENIIYVAGERVISDPLAVPVSRGCDLLCIYSKKHINNEPEKKVQKQLHNKRTMQLMSKLLSEGGKAIYVAPSGGRDRLNKKGEVEIAPFDGQSIEMFYLMAKKAKRPTHFYPLALSTYDVLPPPVNLQKEMGEKRIVNRSPIFIAFGEEIDDMDHFPGSDTKDKIQRRNKRAKFIHNLVKKDYAKRLTQRESL